MGSIRRTAAALKRRLSPNARDYAATRRRIAARHLRGAGLEIGALHAPLPLPPEARVTYVDRMSVDELRSHYPELASERIVAPDVIDDGERLATVDDCAVDFVVASHFIEHCEDPIGALHNHLRVLKPGGILFLAVPDMCRTIDRARPVTSIEHLVEDHRDAGRASRLDHYREWALLVSVPLESVPADQAEHHARELAARDYSIHFHVWTLEAFDQLLRFCRTSLHLPFDVVELAPNHHEFIAVLRRTPG